MLLVKNLPYSLGLRLLALFSLLFLAACDTFQDAPDSENYIFLDREETLYVSFNMNRNLELELKYPQIAEDTEDRRKRQYFESMRNLLHLYRFPMDVHLLEEHEKPGDGPVLDLFAIRWEQDKLGEINVTLKAKLERYGDLNTLGIFKKREHPSVMSSYDRTEQVYATLMEEALSEMFMQLREHFETEEEAAFVEEGLRL